MLKSIKHTLQLNQKFLLGYNYLYLVLGGSSFFPTLSTRCQEMSHESQDDHISPRLHPPLPETYARSDDLVIEIGLAATHHHPVENPNENGYP